ncbi:MAG: serine--tRNA ligase [Bacteroidales bacterium]
MLTLNFIRENKELLIKRLKVKNFDAGNAIDKIIQLDKRRREVQQQSDKLQSEMNTLSKKIGQLFAQDRKEEAAAIKEKTARIKEEVKEMTGLLGQIEKELNDELISVPNIPHELVAPGKSDEDNVKVKEEGSTPSLHDNALPHWELAKKFDIIDFELGTKLTGAGFPVYKGKGAKLQRALINFFLDEGEAAGFSEVLPPIVVNEESGFATGQLPDKEGMMYHVQTDDLYLIPTAEVPVTNIYRDMIMEEDRLPVMNIAYTPCFRREAGSWGSHVRGLNRLHQFDKVEIVVIAHPDRSYEALDMMIGHVENLVRKLELPYRIMRLCGGDISFTSALTYDFEVFSAAQKRWLEVSSVSNFESFQSNRLKCRYRSKGSKQNKLVHTLNGSALALPRILAAILENNQTPDGIRIPGALVKYTGFESI